MIFVSLLNRILSVISEHWQSWQDLCNLFTWTVLLVMIFSTICSTAILFVLHYGYYSYFLHFNYIWWTDCLLCCCFYYTLLITPFFLTSRYKSSFCINIYVVQNCSNAHYTIYYNFVASAQLLFAKSFLY